MDSHVRLGVSPTATPTSFLTDRGFESLVSVAGTLGCLTPQLFLPVYLYANVGLPVQSAALPCCRPMHLSFLPLVSAAPTSLGECFFNSLVVGLPCSLIFWEFWWFLFLDWLLSFFWLCEEGKHLYLHLHLVQNCPEF